MRLKQIAKIINGRLYGMNLEVKDILPPEEADKDSITFLFNKDLKTKAGAVISETRIINKNCIVVKSCKKAMYFLLRNLSNLKRKPSIAKTAVIANDTQISVSSTIEDYTVIKEGVKIGRGCYIGKGVYLDEGVNIGDYCTIDQNVVIYRNTIIGNYVSIGANSVIGKEGFGYIKFKRYKRIPHIGNVIIEDYVEI
ncbi:MAG: hypothetical protein N2738_05130, partial [Thermodesulfovibrionales bacterium]|nr:hypothetical protein [Thermodesulfovibrionales bacterium]